MVKIILSRKGFDSKYGGIPSPIFPDGTMLSFPIPATSNETVSLTYEDLVYGDLLYIDLMKQLNVKDIEKEKKVHLDPDINFHVVERKSENWKAIFGQCDKAASHLKNFEVSKGDIFIFYGLYRQIVKTETGYKYNRKEKEKHVIWGYMEIGDIINIEKDVEYSESYLTHPHFEYRDDPYNTAYVATDRLSFNQNMLGAGTFKFSENLVLSCDPKRKSLWKLPKFFHPDNGVSMTYNGDIEKWAKKDDCCVLQSAYPGQEFVISENTDVEQWAKEMILNH